MIGIILLAILLGYILYHIFLKEKGNPPPEPFGLPFLGHILFMGSTTHMVFKLTEWQKKIGKIMRIRMLNMTDIIIDDPELAKEIYNDVDFSGRPTGEFFDSFADGRNGILFNDGPAWEEQRRFTLWHLRDFGFGKKAVMESKILEEVKEIIERFKKEEGKSLELEQIFNVAVLNSLWSITTGQRYSHDDPQVTLLMDNFEKSVEEMTKFPIVMFMPSLAKRLPKLSGWGYFQESLQDLRNFFNHLITEHKKDLIEDNPRDFVDVYLDEINRTKNPNSSFYKAQGEKSLNAVIFDLFQAGFATTSATLNWSILYLSIHPEIQKKFQDEIDSILGGRVVSLDDKANMPYTEALMMEVFRKSALVGLVPAHSALKDKKFHGYDIKKGSFIAVNLYSIHHNPTIWGDPEKFRPERFLDAKGNCVKRHDALITFSVGKRVCVGESVARDSFFLFLVSIFQRFNIKPNPNSPPPSMDGIWKGMLRPLKYEVIMKDRF